jgi:catechol 2,3-dioxygenase-like lactoylglutathione lyase family enzyme
VLTPVQQLHYVIVLCEDFERMKAFYRDLFAFPIVSESTTDLALRAGSVLLALRKRTRDYDGRGVRTELPGVQLAFLVSPAEVDQCYEQLVAKGVKILDPPADQPRGHRTVYFSDPEGNILEVYAEILHLSDKS